MQNKSGFRSTVQVRVTTKPKTATKSNSAVKQKNNIVKKEPQKAASSSKKGLNDETVNDNADSPSKHLPKNYVLFVGNLPYDVTKEKLEEHFRKTGLYTCNYDK